MEIIFCERCGKRINPVDLESGRCKREELVAWCPPCTRVLSGAPKRSVVAEVGATPTAPHRPTRALPASRTTRRASMATPPGGQVITRRRRTTSAHPVHRRATPDSGKASHRERRRGGSPSDGSPARWRRSTRREGATGVHRPLPAGGLGAPVARHPGDAAPKAKDPTMIYMILGAVLLLFGIILVLYALLSKDEPSRKRSGAAQTERRVSKKIERHVIDPWAKKSVETVGPMSGKKWGAGNKIKPPKPIKRPRPVPQTNPNKLELPPVRTVPVQTPGVALKDIGADISRLTVMRPGKAPLIDGKLDDGCWARMPPVKLRHALEGDAALSVHSTFRLVATESTLYLAAHFNEDEMDRIVMPNKDHDADVWADDCIELFLLPGLDPARTTYQWVVNIAGNTWDGKGVGSKVSAADWNPQGIRVKITKASGHWDVEAAIPFEALPGCKNYNLWRLNITRNRPAREGLERKTEYGSWADLKSASSHTPERFGVAAIEALGGKLSR